MMIQISPLAKSRWISCWSPCPPPPTPPPSPTIMDSSLQQGWASAVWMRLSAVQPRCCEALSSDLFSLYSRNLSDLTFNNILWCIIFSLFSLSFPWSLHLFDISFLTLDVLCNYFNVISITTQFHNSGLYLAFLLLNCYSLSLCGNVFEWSSKKVRKSSVELQYLDILFIFSNVL